MTAVGRALREHATKISKKYGIPTEDIINSVLGDTAMPVWNDGSVDDGRKALTYTFVRQLGE